MVARRVLLVGWDGAHWPAIDPLIERGLMPSLEQLLSRGVMGTLASFDPLVCPMLWTSLVTGRRPDAHGVLGFVESDERGRLHRARRTSRKVKAVWNLLGESGHRTMAVGWMASHPAEAVHGVVVSDRYQRNVSVPPGPLPPNTVHPSHLESTLAELRIAPRELTAAHVAPFVPGAAALAGAEDSELAAIAAIVAECATVHAAATWLIEHESWDFCAVLYDAIAAFSRRFLHHDLALSNGPYRDVVTGAYRFHDMMLGRLLELAGPDTTVMLVSDHGFQTRLGDKVPSPLHPMQTHRGDGIFCLSGPGILTDERIYGASIFDVTPTLLNLFGLPASAEMDGRPLLRAFENMDAVPRIESWENDSTDEAVPATPWLEDVADVPDHLARAPGLDAALTPNFNLARALLAEGRCAEALPLLQKLSEARPENSDLKLMRAQAHYTDGDRDSARELIDELDAEGYRAPMADVLASFLLFAEGRREQAVARLRSAEASDESLPGLHSEVGNAYTQIGLWEDAARAFRLALETDGDRAATRNGLAKTLLELGNFQEASQEALTAVWLKHDYPEAHFHLGAALAQTGHWSRAREAFDTCLALDSSSVGAHLWLARIHESVTGDLEKALEHRRRAKELE